MLSHIVLAQLTKGLETEVSHMASQPGLYDQAAMKTLDSKARENFPAYKSSMHVVTNQCRERNAVYDSMVGEQQEAPQLKLS